MIENIFDGWPFNNVPIKSDKIYRNKKLEKEKNNNQIK